MSRRAGSGGRPSGGSMTIAARRRRRRGSARIGIPKHTKRTASGRRRESRTDKPYSLLACPFRRPCHRPDLATLRIDEKGRRHPRSASHCLESLKDLRVGIGIIAEIVDAGLPEPLPRLDGIAGIDVDGDNLEAGPPEFLLQRVERRHFPPAGDAPRSPQVEENGAPAPFGEMPLPGICITEGEIRNA